MNSCGETAFWREICASFGLLFHCGTIIKALEIMSKNTAKNKTALHNASDMRSSALVPLIPASSRHERFHQSDYDKPESSQYHRRPYAMSYRASSPFLTQLAIQNDGINSVRMERAERRKRGLQTYQKNNRVKVSQTFSKKGKYQDIKA